jgi:hypothetical protein
VPPLPVSSTVRTYRRTGTVTSVTRPGIALLRVVRQREGRTGMPARHALTASEREWLRVRSYLQEHRHDLAVEAAGDYPRDSRVAGTPLLRAASWSPAAPIPLRNIDLTFQPADADQLAAGAYVRQAAGLLPEREDGTRYLRYSDVVKELTAPAVFENRSTYRLTGADLRSARPMMAFGRGRYFDAVDVGEAAAYEYVSVRLGGNPTGLRTLVADPCDVDRRPANLAITTMTVRQDRDSGTASFLLHWRDPTKVGHAGGLYQVVPVGIFQPSGEAAWNEQNDFSLWRCMLREFAEELCGHAEDHGSEERPIDYASWPFAQRLTSEVDAGWVQAWCLGLGTDPLTYATDLLTVVVIDSRVFDDLFSAIPAENAEGRVLAGQEFDAKVIDRITTREPIQAAGAAVLRLAWRHRRQLLS